MNFFRQPKTNFENGCSNYGFIFGAVLCYIFVYITLQVVIDVIKNLDRHLTQNEIILLQILVNTIGTISSFHLSL